MNNPPPYNNVGRAPRKSTTLLSMISDTQLSALRGYDIVYIVDDSSLMGWTEPKSGIVPWPHARDALTFFSTVCAQWDEDGQDLYFLNHPHPVRNATPEQIRDAFSTVTPIGGTNMGRALLQVAHDFFEGYDPYTTKPMNVLAITDGMFSDDVYSTVKWIVQQLDRREALPNAFGVQFVQIGADAGATKALEMLDDDLVDKGLSRDIVDTVPWDPKKLDGPGFDGKYLLKVVCGAINKTLDDDNLGLKRLTAKKKKKGFVRRLFGLA